MVDVEVGDDEVIDAFEAGDSGCDLVDSAGVAWAGVPCVNEHGFSAGSDEQGGAAAFRVDPIDLEAFWGGESGEGERREKRDDEGEEAFGHSYRSSVERTSEAPFFEETGKWSGFSTRIRCGAAGSLENRGVVCSEQRLEVVQRLEIDLVAVRCCEFFGGQANGVFGDGGIFRTVTPACEVGPRCIDEGVILARCETEFGAVERGEHEFGEGAAFARDEGESDGFVVGLKGGGGASCGSEFPTHLGCQPSCEEEGGGFVLRAMADADVFEIPEERGGGGVVEGEREGASESEATHPVQVADVDPSACAVDDPVEALELLAGIQPVAAVEEEFVDPRPNLRAGVDGEFLVPPEVEGQVVIQVGEDHACGCVERQSAGDQGDLFTADLACSCLGEVTVGVDPALDGFLCFGWRIFSVSDEESAACVFADDFCDVAREGLHVGGGAAEHDQVDEGSSRAGCVEFPELFEVAG